MPDKARYDRASEQFAPKPWDVDLVRENARLKLRLAFVTTQFPFGPKEPFLEAEARALAPLVDELVVIAVRPMTQSPVVSLEAHALSPFAVSTLSAARTTLLSRPLATAQAVKNVVRSRSRPAAALKNIIVLHQGAALAEVVRRRRIDHIHAHWLSTASTIAMVAAETSGIPWSCTAHSFDVFAENALARKGRSARFIRMICERNRHSLAKQIDATDRDKLKVVHMGVVMPPAPAPLSRRTDIRLICGANLVSVKGHSILLEALSRARRRGVRITCDFAGEGPERQNIVAAIERLGLAENVRLLGHVRHDALLARMQTGHYDVAALASVECGHDHEGIPVFLMEAMAAGVPCVATRTGAIPELVTGESGLLVEQRDSEQMAAAFERMTSYDFRRKTGVAARARVAEAFEVSRTAARLVALIEAVGT